MKRQKRNRFARAHNQGYYAGMVGKHKEACPFTSINIKEHWLAGWREAKIILGAGYHY
jgi:ribosome modulation factor